MTNPIRIFISSPGDVAVERDKARKVVAQLQDWYGGEQVALEALLWEDLPLDAVTSFQAGVDAVLSATTGVDIAVFILWSRMGSPLGSDVRKADGSAYLSGTEREFDLMWQAREAQGDRPAILVYVRKDDHAFRQRLDVEQTDQLVDIVHQRKTLESFLQTRFQDDAGHNRGAYHTYADPTGFVMRLRAHLKELIDARLQSAERREVLWTDVPYRGLEYFDIEQSRIFFGRNQEVADVLQVLSDREARGEASFVCIVGASGAGKSSLARAGIAAALLEDRVDSETGGWRIATFVPREADGSLHRGLARALQRAFPELLETLGAPALSDAGFDGLTVLFETAVKGCLGSLVCGGRAARLLLIVDQLEELYLDPRIGPDQRAGFWKFISTISREGSASAVTTLRSDYYARAQEDDGFLAIKGSAGMYDLTPPRPEALDPIILRPAAMSGLSFEHDAHGNSLGARIIADAQGHRESLPSLQDLLRALYERRDGNGQLTFAAYEALGGVAGVTGRRAEAIFDTLPQAQKDALPTLLRRLVTIQPDASAPSAHPVKRDLINKDSPEGQLVDAFLAPAARLLVSEDGNLRVVHESLLRNWPLVAQCIEADREHHKTNFRLGIDFEQWQDGCKADNLLLPAGQKLDRAESLVAAWGCEQNLVPKPVVEFVRLSQRKIKERKQKRHLALLVVCAVGIAASGIGYERYQAMEEQHRKETDESSRMSARLAAGVHAMTEGDSSTAWFVTGTTVADVLDRHKEIRGSESALDEVTTHSRPPIILRGHDALLTKVTLSPDGKRALTASGDASARIWDTESGRLISILRGHDDRVSAIAFSRDGAYVVTGSDDSQVRLWDAITGQQLGPVLAGHRKEISIATFCDACDRLLIASRDGTTIVRDVPNGKPIRILSGNSRPVLVGALSPDGRQAVTATGDDTDGRKVATAIDDTVAYLWDIDSERAAVRLNHRSRVTHAAFSRDGTRIITVTLAGSIHLWDRSGRVVSSMPEQDAIAVEVAGSQVLMQHSESGSELDRWTGLVFDLERGRQVGVACGDVRIIAARFSTDGKTLAAVCEDQAVHVWNLPSGTETRVLRGHSGPLTAVSIAGDGKRVLTGSEDKTARLWETSSHAEGKISLQMPRPANSIAISPDGRYVLTASDDKTAHLWNQEGRELSVLSGHSDVVTDASFGPDGKLVTASEDGTARLWDTAGQPLQILRDHEDAVRTAVFSSDGKRILTASYDGTARVWDAGSGRPHAVLKGHGGPLRRAVFNAAGDQVASISDDETARLWSPDGKALAVLTGHTGALLSLAYSPDGKLLATGSRDGTARLWDKAGGRQLRVLSGHTNYVSAVAFSPDGRWLATASGDSSARIWNVASGAEQSVLRGHEGAVTALAFSPDGTSLATASEDMTVREWDPATGRQKAIHRGHKHWIGALAWSPDGRRLATASQDHTVRLWPARRPLAEQADFALAMAPLLPDAALRERFGLSGEHSFERLAPAAKGATECDTLAAHPFDSQRTSTGVRFNKLEARNAVEACRRAVEKAPDVARLRYQLGRALERFGDDDGARVAYVASAKQGYLRAQGALGSMLLESGGEKSRAEAIDWLRRAAHGGDAASQSNLANLLHEGEHVPRDLAEARRLAALAAAQGVPEAHQSLAEIAEASNPATGSRPDYELAFFHHTLAARCAQAVADEDTARFATERRAALARLLPQEKVVALWRKANQWKPGMNIDVKP